jgi:hypothetical protein
MMKFLTAATLASLVALGATAPAISADPARSPVNFGQWSIDTTVVGFGRHWNTVEVCLKSDGTWYSTEQRKGSGRWIVTGNRVLLHGNFEVLVDSADLTLAGPGKMSGFLQQWVPHSLAANDQENLFTSSNWTWLSGTCKPAF